MLATERAVLARSCSLSSSAPPFDGAEQLAFGADRADLARPETASREIYGAFAGRTGLAPGRLEEMLS
jgi:hypothetical protein